MWTNHFDNFPRQPEEYNILCFSIAEKFTCVSLSQSFKNFNPVFLKKDRLFEVKGNLIYSNSGVSYNVYEILYILDQAIAYTILGMQTPYLLRHESFL